MTQDCHKAIDAAKNKLKNLQLNKLQDQLLNKILDFSAMQNIDMEENRNKMYKYFF